MEELIKEIDISVLFTDTINAFGITHSRFYDGKWIRAENKDIVGIMVDVDGNPVELPVPGTVFAMEPATKVKARIEGFNVKKFDYSKYNPNNRVATICKFKNCNIQYDNVSVFG